MKVQDGFNEIELKKTKIGEKAKKDVSFTGHKVVQDDNGNLAYRFYLPGGLKHGDNFEVQLVELKKDNNGNYEENKDSDLDIKTVKSVKGDNYIQYSFSRLGVSENDHGIAIGYKFKLNGKEYLDSTLLTPDRKWNIATPPNRPLLEEARPMYHIMPDLMLTKEAEAKVLDARRTHFNKFGGSIDGIIQKIDYIHDLGAKRILGTPIFGQDNISSHGYWTTNPYQITGQLGDASKFKQLNTELFKRGMGWIADGAFVNEGLEGIHLAHVMKWGTKSPYLNWLECYNFNDRPFTLGVLPKKEEQQKFVGIKLINAPYKIEPRYNSEREQVAETVEKNKNYDPKKPTYVQLYDSRLASDTQIKDDKVIRVYDNKNPKDPNQVNDYMDAVLPYCFEVTPKEVELNYQKYQDAKKQNSDNKFANQLKDWTHFSLVTSDPAGGFTNWVGNRDIAKLRFMVDENTLNPEKKTSMNIAVNQVQDNIVQVGQFWTNEVAKTLQEHAAKQLKGANTPEEYAQKIKEAAGDQLPESAASKVKQNHIENLLVHKTYNLKSTPAPKNVTDGLMSYPLDAIEFNPSTCSVLGSPYLKKLASTESQIGKSRYEVYEKQQESDYKDIPEDFRKQYKEMDNVIADNMTDAALEILKKVDESRKKRKEKNILDVNENLTDDGKELYGLIAGDVAKFVVTQGLLRQASSDSLNNHLFASEKISPDYGNKESLVYKPELLDKVSTQSLGIHAATPEIEAETMTNCLKSGISKITEDDKNAFAEHIDERLKGLDGNKVKVAKLLVDKTESGLEWRIDAAKDVCPVELINQGKVEFEPAWSKGIKFWEKFTSGVRQYNPRAYEILEVTNEGDMVKATPKNKRIKYKDSHEAALKLIQGANATTPTNYSYLYDWPHKMYGAFTENGDTTWIGPITEKLLHGWCAGAADHSYGFLHSGSQDTINQSHNGVGNHDKPRTLHGFGLDMNIAMDNYGWDNSLSRNAKLADIYGQNKEITRKINLFYGIKSDEAVDLSKINTMALAMGIAIKDGLENSKTFNELQSEDAKNAIKQAVINLSKGKYTKEDGTKGHFEAEFFGVRPYDYNIDSIYTEAKRASKDAFKDVSDSKLKEIKKEALENMLKPAMAKYRAVVGLLTAMPGNPTIYAGDELGETGFETKSKNVYVQNRNIIHYDRAEEIEEVKKQKKEIAKLMNLRKDPVFSPLVNGSTSVLQLTDWKVAGLYRYNDKTDMFILLNKEGFGPERNQTGLKGELKVPYIDLSTEMKLNKEGNNSEAQAGLLTNLPTYEESGAEYKNALKPDDKTTFRIVKLDDSKKVLKQFNEHGKEMDNIEMTGSDLFLYRSKDFKGNDVNPQIHKAPAFAGNPHVAIANAKFNIPSTPQNNFVQLNKFQNKTKALV